MQQVFSGLISGLQCIFAFCVRIGMASQNEERPGQLRNDGNDFLSYTDDWYILGWKKDAYAVIYYKGNNDAWKGYGGATVYTR